MPFTTYYGSNTTVSESCLWIADGSRRICLTYNYNTASGILQYAASVFRCTKPTWADIHNTNFYIEPEISQMMAHEHTTTRRFQIRPVIIQVASGLGYDAIIHTIRREMCHGYGCKGPRGLTAAFQDVDMDYSDDGSDGHSSTNSFLTDDDNMSCDENYIDVDFAKLDRKRMRKLRYIGTSKVENYFGNRIPVTREYFITFKADKNNGHLIYGAAISRRPTADHETCPMTDDLVDGHFRTAMARMDKAPVFLEVSEEFRHQLKKNVAHREDVMYEIIDRINERDGGRLAVRCF